MNRGTRTLESRLGQGDGLGQRLPDVARGRGLSAVRGPAHGTLILPILPALLMIWLVSVAAPAGAAVYKWVDESGVTQYSATPPPGQDASTVHIRPSPPREVTEEAAKRLEQRILESRELDARKTEAARDRSEQAEGEKKRALQRCRHAKENLHILVTQGRVYRLNENMERVYVNDQDRASQIQTLKEQVAADCE